MTLDLVYLGLKVYKQLSAHKALELETASTFKKFPKSKITWGGIIFKDRPLKTNRHKSCHDTKEQMLFSCFIDWCLDLKKLDFDVCKSF